MEPRLTTRIAPILLMAMMLFASYASPHAAGPIAVMLLDGESGGPWHKWALTTPALKKALEDTALFKVHVVTAPSGELTGFKPSFKDYRVVVMNYYAPEERWPAALTEWAATGASRRRSRRPYPTAETVSYRPDIAAMDLNYKKGLDAFDTAK